MSTKFKKIAAVTLVASMLSVMQIPTFAGTAYDYYHQEFTNAGVEQRLEGGAQSGDLAGWTAHYEVDGINGTEGKPEGVYITESGTLKLQTYKNYSDDSINGQPAASLDYSDFSGKDGNYTISFKMKLTGGNRFNAIVGSKATGRGKAAAAYTFTTQMATGAGYDDAGAATAIYGTNTTAQVKPTANTWYDVQMYINNTDKKFNVWIDGVPQTNGTSCDFPLNSLYDTENHVAPSFLTFSPQPSGSNKNIVVMEIDDVIIKSGRYDLLYQNNSWNAANLERISKTVAVVSNGAKYSNDVSLGAAGADNTKNNDYSVKSSLVNASGTTAIDATKPLVAEALIMPGENMGRVCFTERYGKRIGCDINAADLLAGQWNKIKLVYMPASGEESATSAVYLNGKTYHEELYTVDALTAEVDQVKLTISKKLYGSDDVTTDNLNNMTCFVDDFKVYQTDLDNVLYETYPTFTAADGWVATDVETAAKQGGELQISETVTLADIKACVGANTEVRLFESDLETPATEAAVGTKLVLVSETGVYVYYDVCEYVAPSESPTPTPTVEPTEEPTPTPTVEPTAEPIDITFSGAAVEGLENGKVQTGEITAISNTVDGVLVIAEYGENDQLIKCTVGTANEAGTELSASLTVSSEAKKVRAFLWEDLDETMLPIIDAKVLSVD